MARGQWEILLVVAGVLIFLPDFVQSMFLPFPEIKTIDAATIAILNGWFAANFVPLLIAAIAMRLGEATLLVLLLDPTRPTVGQAIAIAARLLPAFFLLNLLVTFAVATGFVLLIVPGIYLIGRLLLAAPAMLATRRASPIAALETSLAMTRGRGFSIAVLVLLIAIVLAILISAVGSVLTVTLSLLLSEGPLAAMTALVTAAMSAAATLVMTILSAAVFRRLVQSKGI